MNPENTSLPFPPHTPPTAPEGMRWKYRGGGRANDLTLFNKYFVRPDGTTSEEGSSHAYGREDLHFFEAVPDFANMSPEECLHGKNPEWTGLNLNNAEKDPEREKRRLAELAEAREKVQEVFESPSPFEKTPDGLGFTSTAEAAAHFFPKSPTGTSIGIDPKGEAGAKKAPLCLLPSFPLHETSWVLDSGRKKYGIFNWRSNKVCASTYRSAMQRHLDQWFDGLEDADAETSRSHLAHVIASACIVMDAAKHGMLVDDRPNFERPHTLKELMQTAEDPMSEMNKSFARGGPRNNES